MARAAKNEPSASQVKKEKMKEKKPAGKTLAEEPSKLSKKDRDQKVKEVLRYILCNSTDKNIIKYKDIKDKAMEPFAHAMDDIMARVKPMLEKNFGMELVELPEVKEEAIVTKHHDTQEEGTVLKYSSAKSSKSYALLNALPAEARATYNRETQDTSKAGLLMSILGFIFVKNMEVTQKMLDAFLKEINVEQKSKNKAFGEDGATLINEFIKQKYIWAGYLKESNDSSRSKTYRWGTRARAEISQNDMIGFLAGVYEEDQKEWVDQVEHVRVSRQTAMEGLQASQAD